MRVVKTYLLKKTSENLSFGNQSKIYIKKSKTYLYKTSQTYPQETSKTYPQENIKKKYSLERSKSYPWKRTYSLGSRVKETILSVANCLGFLCCFDSFLEREIIFHISYVILINRKSVYYLFFIIFSTESFFLRTQHLSFANGPAL